jgi:hypothetical protein
MKKVTLSELQNDVKKCKPVGVLRSFSDDDDRFDYELESHPVFQERVKRSRALFREGKGIRIEDVEAVFVKFLSGASQCKKKTKNLTLFANC